MRFALKWVQLLVGPDFSEADTQSNSGNGSKVRKADFDTFRGSNFGVLHHRMSGPRPYFQMLRNLQRAALCCIRITWLPATRANWITPMNIERISAAFQVYKQAVPVT